MNAMDAARAAGRDKELHDQLMQLVTVQNTSSDGEIAIPATFMKVTVLV